MKKIKLGIDIGGTNTKLGIVNEHGDILARELLYTTAYDTPEDFVEGLNQVFEKLLSSLPLSSVTMDGIGVCAPNANYLTGNIENAPNLRWKGCIPLQNIIQNRFGTPCVLCNDANAAAMGEMKYGVAKDIKDFIMITLGTGVGSGIISNGKLILGHDSFAGELGHTMIKLGGRKHWSTGLKGTLESYASGTGIAITAIKMRKKAPNSMLNHYAEKDINAKIVYDCAKAGDSTAIEVFRYTGELLGRALANFIMFSSPEAIVLFGGVTQARDLLLKPTQYYMEQALLPIFKGKVKLLLSGLNNADAAILGATVIATENIHPLKK